jgi:murein DD-endopeptidase MepM/ murein hydrolase activator NlpD
MPWTGLLFLLSCFVSPLLGQTTSSVRLADSFQRPVGMDGKKYYRARGMTPNGHLGDDWNGQGGGDTDLGAPVTSTARGIVVYANDFRHGWGNVVIIRHAYLEGERITYVDSLYGHLHTILVQEGQHISRGQKVGTIGNNHGMYSAHLHFELRKNLQIGMARGAFARDFTNYWDPNLFIALHSHLQGDGRFVSVPINTFVPYDGPNDLEAATHFTGTNSARSPLTPNPNAQPSSTSRLRLRSVYKVEPYGDMHQLGY